MVVPIFLIALFRCVRLIGSRKMADRGRRRRRRRELRILIVTHTKKKKVVTARIVLLSEGLCKQKKKGPHEKSREPVLRQKK